MWDLLRKVDIEHAKQHLKLRRAEILRRHEEEAHDLDTHQTELEKLNLLADLFAQKYKRPAVPSPAPAPAAVSAQKPATAAVSTQKIGDKPSPETRHQHHRDQHRHQPQPQPNQHQTGFAT